MSSPNPTARPLSLYLHVPFCRTRCVYCDFNTYAGLEALIAPYVRALARELTLVGQAAGERRGVHTIYLGGGTPSLLAPRQVETILRACRDSFAVTPGAEISIEANPGTVTGESLSAIRALGVNRLSLGVQSAHPRELRLLGRSHSFAEAADAFRLARQAGYGNISIDLIYGLPGQSVVSWIATLEAVLAWEPDHVSAYSLTLEKGTPLEARVKAGRIPAPDDDRAAAMYEAAQERLEAAGLPQYEISNWARAGYACRHNRQYWLNRPYLGLGAGAHGAVGGMRYWNVGPPRDYINRVTGEGPRAFPLSPAVDGFEVLSERTVMAETVILGLRLVHEGVDEDLFRQRTGRALLDVYGQEIADLEALGLLCRGDGRIRLARRAYLVGNQVFLRFLPPD